MDRNPGFKTSFDANGYALVMDVLTSAACDDLTRELERLPSVSGGDRRGGIRNLFQAAPAVAALARSTAVRSLVEPILGHEAFAVRATLFDKVEDANWRVPWHRDRVIAVRSRIEVPDFRAWSVKEGVQHVEPPREFLDRMLSIRLHLDAVDADNGPLRVIPGSHRDPEVGDGHHDSRLAVSVIADRGSALIMRPLLAHASSPAQRPSHRRVVHVDFAAFELPGGLEWNERW